MDTAWFRPLSRPTFPRITLICFPFGGGHSGAFRTWAAKLPADVRLLGVDLPGRGARFGEPLMTQFETVLPPLLAACSTLDPTRPFAFYGHSLGATIAFELTHALAREHRLMPRHLIVSGRGAPDLPRRTSPIARLDDVAFLAEVRRYQGLPEEVLAHRELLELFLPVLRADFGLSESYVHTPGPPLPLPITAFGGCRDPMVDVATLDGWARQTATTFASHVFDGGHFFPDECVDELIARIAKILGSHLSGAPAIAD